MWKKAAPETKKKLTEQVVPLNEIQVGVRNAVKNVEETKSEIAAKGGSMITSIKQLCQGLTRYCRQKREGTFSRNSHHCETEYK